MENFSVYLSGATPNTEEGLISLKESLIQVLCLDNDEAEDIIAKIPTVVEHSLSKASADALADMLKAIGGVVEVRDTVEMLRGESESEQMRDYNDNSAVALSTSESKDGFIETVTKPGLDDELICSDLEDDIDEDDLLLPSDDLDLLASEALHALEVPDENNDIVPELNVDIADDGGLALSFDEDDSPSLAKGRPAEALNKADPQSTVAEDDSNLSFELDDDPVESSLSANTLEDLLASQEDVKVEIDSSAQVIEDLDEDDLSLQALETSIEIQPAESILSGAAPSEPVIEATNPATVELSPDTAASPETNSSAITKSIPLEVKQAPDNTDIPTQVSEVVTDKPAQQALKSPPLKIDKKISPMIIGLGGLVLMACIAFFLLPTDTSNPAQSAQTVMDPEFMKKLLKAQTSSMKKKEEPLFDQKDKWLEAISRNRTWTAKVDVETSENILMASNIEFNVNSVSPPQPEEYIRKKFVPRLASFAVNYKSASLEEAKLTPESGVPASARMYVLIGEERRRLTVPVILQYKAENKTLRILSSVEEEDLAPGSFSLEESVDEENPGKLSLKLHLMILLKESAPPVIKSSLPAPAKNNDEKGAKRKSKKKKKSSKAVPGGE